MVLEQKLESEYDLDILIRIGNELSSFFSLTSSFNAPPPPLLEKPNVGEKLGGGGDGEEEEEKEDSESEEDLKYDEEEEKEEGVEEGREEGVEEEREEEGVEEDKEMEGLVAEDWVKKLRESLEREKDKETTEAKENQERREKEKKKKTVGKGLSSLRFRKFSFFDEEEGDRRGESRRERSSKERFSGGGERMSAGLWDETSEPSSSLTLPFNRLKNITPPPSTTPSSHSATPSPPPSSVSSSTPSTTPTPLLATRRVSEDEVTFSLCASSTSSSSFSPLSPSPSPTRLKGVFSCSPQNRKREKSELLDFPSSRSPPLAPSTSPSSEDKKKSFLRGSFLTSPRHSESACSLPHHAPSSFTPRSPRFDPQGMMTPREKRGKKNFSSQVFI